MNGNMCRDKLLSQHIEVALVYKDMLGLDEAIDYLQRESIPEDISQRVLTTERRRPQAAPTTSPPAVLQYPGCRRKNHVHHAIVEAALKIERQLGVEWALALLWDERVPDSVAARVTAQGPRQVRVKRQAP